MPRKPLKPRERRPLPPPDIKYNSVLVQRLINKIMWDGKKTLAARIVYKAFDVIKKRTKKEPLEVFRKAVNNAKPLLEVKPRRVGGATFQVPVEVPQIRGETLAMRWMVQFARAKDGKPMHEKLADEIISAYRNEGSAVKKKEDLYKMAEANRAFVHYRW